MTDIMAGLGFQLVAAGEGTMDSGAAHYTDGAKRVAVLKDRSQWFIGGSREVLEPLDCWRAFDDVSEFCEALVRYVGSQRG